MDRSRPVSLDLRVKVTNHTSIQYLTPQPGSLVFKTRRSLSQNPFETYSY